MGAPFDDIKARVKDREGGDLLHKDLRKDLNIIPHHESPQPGDGPIKLFEIVVSGNSLRLRKEFFPGTGETAKVISERFLDTGGLPENASAKAETEVDSDRLVGDDILSTGTPGTSQFDLPVRGPEVYLFRLSIDSLYVDPRCLSFDDTKFHPHYGNCAYSTDGKRFAFASRGDSEHFKSFWVDETKKEEQRHKFNLHLVLTPSVHTQDPDERHLTRIIIDPKARDGGGPGG